MLAQEKAILDWIQDHWKSEKLDKLMVKYTTMGNAGAIWIGAGLALMTTKKYRAAGATLLSALAIGGFTANMIIKKIVARPRPCWLEDIELPLPNPKDTSFPSGHSMASASAAVSLTYADGMLGVVALPAAVLMAFSRMYLYLHYPTDVLGGILLGSVLGMVSGKYIYPKFKKVFDKAQATQEDK